MIISPDQSWTARVNSIFDTRPRDGTKTGPVWVNRGVSEKRLQDLLFQDGVHICVDGPSGTGKTSLVTTQLSRNRLKSISIQVTNKMTWVDFCREIIGDIRSKDPCLSFEFMIGLEEYIKPRASAKIASNPKSTDHLTRWKDVGHLINDYDLCRALDKSGSVLFIDDFEKACDEISLRVADICKLMTQKFKGKIVIVGTGNIYFEIMSREPALEGRISELSIGTLANADQGWDFLSDGFDRLYKNHPTKMYSNGRIDFEKLRECKEAVNDAADSLPKALNELGRCACLEAGDSRDLKPDKLKETATKLLQSRVAEYTKQFPKFTKIVSGNAEAKLVMSAIYDISIGQPLTCDDIFSYLKNQISSEQFDIAIDALKDNGIITQTGKSGEIIFLSNLSLAHTFGVCISKFKKYPFLDPSLFGPGGQLHLPLTLKD